MGYCKCCPKKEKEEEKEMKTVWLKDCKTEEKQRERKTQIVTAARAFEVLTKILEDKIASKETERNGEATYSLNSYPFYQADASGYIRALREVQSLIDIKEP